MTKREKFASEVSTRINRPITIKRDKKMKATTYNNIVLEVSDHGGDIIIIGARDKFYPDTVDSNEFIASYMTSDGYLAHEHRGITLARALELMNEWLNVELMEV